MRSIEASIWTDVLKMKRNKVQNNDSWPTVSQMETRQAERRADISSVIIELAALSRDCPPGEELKIYIYI